ncbi:MAG TPA: type II secretion system protein GspG [Verrucomicrobiae bacterium]|nr:type II secretion system protein GspG [Verrucomicrobiae bacterium]
MDKSSRLFWFLVLAQACAVVLAIISLTGSHPSSYAREMAARADISGGLKTILDTFSNDCGRYPTTAEGLQALITFPTNLSQRLWKGPYIDPPQIPVDPWGHEYVYRCPGIHNTNSYDLYSVGADGVSKKGGNDPDDISSWDPKSPLGDPVADDAFFLGAFVLLSIPFAWGGCSISAFFSPRWREFFSRNRTAHIVWMIISVIAFMMFLSTHVVLR